MERQAKLTPREQQILALYVQGFTHKQIAERLGMGVRTVGTHLRSIRSIMGTRDREKLIEVGTKLARPKSKRH